MPPFDFYGSMIESDYAKEPDNYYRSLQQAFIDSQWDNTSSKTPENGGVIEEQVDIGSDEYRCIEAWVTPTVADVSTGTKDSNDFLKMIFRDITHTVKRGLYYRFDGNYWIVHTYNQFNGLTQYVGVRRCNNWLRVIDPNDGTVYQQPCVIGYDMSSPGIQISSYVITPNNHATITTQANEKSLRLFKLNTRFIISGRPFKLYSFQNALSYSATDEQPTYLELDLYLDEVHDGDDFENGIADNGTYNFTTESTISQVAEGAELTIVGLPSKIKQYQSVTVEVKLSVNGETIEPTKSFITVPDGSEEYFSVVKNNNIYTFTCLKIASESFAISFVASNDKAGITIEKTINLQCVSMLG